MADQTVRVTNLPNTDSGSPQRVAYDLLLIILRANEGRRTKDAVLDLYSECLQATLDRRLRT
jgi:hypothetical protein